MSDRVKSYLNRLGPGARLVSNSRTPSPHTCSSLVVHPMSSVPSSCPPTPAISGSASENGSILPLSRSSDVERATLPLTTAISSANSAVGESGSQPVSWRLLQPRTHPLSFRMIRWAEVCLHSLFLRRTWWIGEQSSPQLLTHPLSSWMLRWVEAGPRIHPLSPRGYGGGAVSQAG